MFPEPPKILKILIRKNFQYVWNDSILLTCRRKSYAPVCPSLENGEAFYSYAENISNPKTFETNLITNIPISQHPVTPSKKYAVVRRFDGTTSSYYKLYEEPGIVV